MHIVLMCIVCTNICTFRPQYLSDIQNVLVGSSNSILGAAIHHMTTSILARVHLENLDPLDLLGKRVLLVSVETMGPPEDKESEDQRDHLAAQETKGTLEKTDPR